MFTFTGKKQHGIKLLLVSGVTGLSLMFTACSGATPDAGKVEPTASNGTSVESSTSSPQETKAPAPAGRIVETDKGKYLQTVLPENSPFYSTAGATMHEGLTAVYSEAEIASGVKATLDYTVKNIIDPPVIDGELSKDKWWETVKDDFSAEHGPEFYAKLESLDPENGSSDSPVVDNPWWADKEYQGFSYVYDENETRIKNLNIKITDVWAVETGDLAVKAQISYEIPASYDAKAGEPLPTDGSRKKTIQRTSGDSTISVIKNSSGKWVISGWQKNVNSPTTDL